jgi:hypothetical protein
MQMIIPKRRLSFHRKATRNCVKTTTEITDRVRLRPVIARILLVFAHFSVIAQLWNYTAAQKLYAFCGNNIALTCASFSNSAQPPI